MVGKERTGILWMLLTYFFCFGWSQRCRCPPPQVIGTDLANHFTALGAFRAEISSGGSRIQNLVDADHATVGSVLGMMLKCADVGHACKTRRLHLQWTARITAEFFHQGDKERSHGIAVSSLCDRNSCIVPSSQLGFFEYIVLPMYSSWNTFLALSGFDQVSRRRVGLLLVSAASVN